ncbi:c-type cytochrome [bacterium]|nr:c-type cytochrome [bacterium]MDB4705692.1 c-type cytochrome [Verrucomicrobiota bacterium]
MNIMNSSTKLYSITAVFFCLLISLLPYGALAQVVGFPASKTAMELRRNVFEQGQKSDQPFANFRLFMKYQLPAGQEGAVHLGQHIKLNLLSGNHVMSIEHEHLDRQAGRLFAMLDGREMMKMSLPVKQTSQYQSTQEEASSLFSMDGDYTVSARFVTEGSGTLFAKCMAEGKWSPNAKALFIRDGRLVFDIGWLGAVSGGPKVNDGKPHHVVLHVRNGDVELFLDGQSVGKKRGFMAEDENDHVFKIGASAQDFGLDWEGGDLQQIQFWKGGLRHLALSKLIQDESIDKIKVQPGFDWQGAIPEETFNGDGVPGYPVFLRVAGPVRIQEAWVQPLVATDHAQLMADWDDETMETGRKLYHSLCVTCHGTAQTPGSLPTALKFHEGAFKNGKDPYGMFQTLSRGYGLMVPQGQYTRAEKYAVIQYIRENLIKPHNNDQYFEVNAPYLASLPRPLKTLRESEAVTERRDNQYELMDFGPALMWTYQVNDAEKISDWNIAQKGINIRLNPGDGGVSKGRAWMVYDEDTMRVAAAYSGDAFTDWRGIAFDGSHGTHTRIKGDVAWINSDAPAWKHPSQDTWEDQRIVGRDGRQFGPLPKDWVHYKGLYYHEDKAVIRYTVGNTMILEKPGVFDYGSSPIFVRTFNVAPHSQALVSRIAPDRDDLAVSVRGASGVMTRRLDGFVELVIPAGASDQHFNLLIAKTDEDTLKGLEAAIPVEDLEVFTRGGKSRFEQKVIHTQGVQGNSDEPFAVDVLTVPDALANPWESWMRLGGFDFFPDNPDRAAVCTWMGDVWLVDGVAGDLKDLRWRRICSGLFQPLGLKIHEGFIYVTCRDQIARLHDFNGDQEIDYVESFNNDAQVTEHFHEFAMGLQVDQGGNFYYAKSARHAKTALVPHHGTLLRVSSDGSRTDIVANGFRAANGVCLNPDGTWIVTDQEGHWNPKNRINYVKEGGFYGNMFGYHDVKDSSDEAMEQPLCWITNGFDRSPAELLWATEPAQWGALNGVLLNLSYGYGKIYTVPHELIQGQAQGGMCELPISQFPTGVMRGRFHPGNGQLYGAGMFAWAGTQHQAGGFYRIRYTGKPAYMPTALEAIETGMRITFSDPLDKDFTENAAHYKVQTWSLKRTANYGSRHYDERELAVKSAVLSQDRRTLFLEIPEIHPTWGMEMRCELKGADGNEPVTRVIHNSIHHLGKGLF